MTDPAMPIRSADVAPRHSNLFGIPLDQLGWFASLLMSLAAGFLAFFLSCFLAIFGVLFYNSSAHRTVDFAVTYEYIGLPIGLAVLGFSLVYLGTLWARRVFGAKSVSS